VDKSEDFEKAKLVDAAIDILDQQQIYILALEYRNKYLKNSIYITMGIALVVPVVDLLLIFL